MAKGRLAPWYHPDSPAQKRAGLICFRCIGRSPLRFKGKNEMPFGGSRSGAMFRAIPCRLAPTAGSLKGF